MKKTLLLLTLFLSIAIYPQKEDKCQVPSGLSTNNITENSAFLNWAKPTDVIYSQINYKKSTDKNWKTATAAAPGHGYLLKNLEPETTYFWQIIGFCSKGNSYSYPASFKTKWSCKNDVTVTKNVTSGKSDEQSAYNTLTATNTIYNKATANYHAGQSVTLKNGFTVQQGASFRGHIKGCTKNSSRSVDTTSIDDDQEDISFDSSARQTNNEVLVYPNPFVNEITIKSDKKIHNCRLLNLFDIEVKSGLENQISIGGIANGSYVLQVTFKDGQIVRKKIIKQ